MKKFVLVSGLLLLFLPLIPVAEMRGLLPLLMEFPLRTHRMEPPAFSVAVFSLFSILALLSAAILIFPHRFGFKSATRSAFPNRSMKFPRWGWAGIFLGLTAWICAWGQFDFLKIINDYMFFPLWLGYILTIDAIVFHRSGESMISKSPRTFFVLFPASAFSWWYFEYINRFVQNWWYAGVENYTAAHYTLLATISFSTVLPAVFETRDFLNTFPWFQQAYANGPAWREPSRGALFIWLFAGVAALVATGWNPRAFFYLVWLAPLIILGSMMALAGVETPLTAMRRGDYGPLLTLAVAALMCGWFWEMWNYFSMPKWYYSVPFVMKYRIFEMPIPGYAGYLTFGPICGLMWDSMRGLVKD